MTVLAGRGHGNNLAQANGMSGSITASHTQLKQCDNGRKCSANAHKRSISYHELLARNGCNGAGRAAL